MMPSSASMRAAHIAVNERVSEAPAPDDPVANASAWLKRAAAHTARNECDDASRSCDRAVALGAPPAAVLVSRSLIALKRGDTAASLQHALRAVEADPCSAAAQINAAIVEGSLHGYERSLARLALAETLGTAGPAVHGVRAYALLKLGRFAAAAAVAGHACACVPHDPSAHEVRALALKALGRDSEAIALLDRPEVLGLNVRLRVVLAVTQMDIGRRADAIRTLRTALECNPNDAYARYVLADLGDFDAAGNDIAALERLVECGNATAGGRIMLMFALGKAYLARGECARAFAHFRSGNERKRQRLAYDVAIDERAMDALRSEFSAATLAAGFAGGNPSERPVFIVGMPRSGTSLVEQILASHSAVFGAGELTAMSATAIRCRESGRDAWPALAAAYLEAAGANAGDALRVVDKLPLTFVNAGLVRLLFPNARIIHCRRDPVDTGVSCYTTLFDDGNAFTYDLTELGRFTRAYHRLMDHWRSVLTPDRFLEIDYEAIVAGVEHAARRLIAFCGLPWEDAVLRFYETQRPVRTASYVAVRRPIYRTSVNRAAAFGAALDPLRHALENLGAGP
jgi:tetratricopeptide (TPR) repeat protein